MKRVCFAACPSWPGVYNFLGSIRTVIKETFPDIEVKTVTIEEKLSFNVVHAIKSGSFDFLLIGGWNENIKTIIQNMDHARTKVALQWCSPLLQMELSGEIPRFLEALQFADKGLIDYLCLLTKSDVSALSSVNNKITFMPVYMDTAELDSVEAQPLNGKHCDLFCGPCPRKNLISQAVALAKIKDLFVHTNFPQHPGNLMYETFFKKVLGDNWINHHWMERKNYLKMCKSMNFGMQVSLSESYNYTAAEHMYFGVPTLMSNASPMTHGLPDLLLVKNPNDVIEIMGKANILMDENIRDEASRQCKNHIDNYNSDSKKELIATLSKMLGV
jgi:hypothetical protein